MKKLIAITLGLCAFIAFAFASPTKSVTNSQFQEEPLIITLEGIEDGATGNSFENEFLSETE
jgi:hypothetical protein